MITRLDHHYKKLNAMPLLTESPVWTLLAEGAKDAPAAPGAGSLLMGPLLPFVMIGILFYFLMIRPERRKRAEMNDMLANLKGKDRVATIGGILGTIVSINDAKNEVTLSVDDNNNLKLRMQRNAIARVITDEARERK